MNKRKNFFDLLLEFIFVVVISIGIIIMLIGTMILLFIILKYSIPLGMLASIIFSATLLYILIETEKL